MKNETIKDTNKGPLAGAFPLAWLREGAIHWSTALAGNKMPPGAGALTNGHWAVWEDAAIRADLYRALAETPSDAVQLTNPTTVAALHDLRPPSAGAALCAIPTQARLIALTLPPRRWPTPAQPVVEIRGVVLNAFYVAMVMAVTGATHVLLTSADNPVAFVREGEGGAAAIVMPTASGCRPGPGGPIAVRKAEQPCARCDGDGMFYCHCCGSGAGCDACGGRGWVASGFELVDTPQAWVAAMTRLMLAPTDLEES